LLPINLWSALMAQPNDLSRSLVALDQNSTIIAVVEMSQSSWLVGGILPGIEAENAKQTVDAKAIRRGLSILQLQADICSDRQLAQLPHFSEQNPDISKGWLFFSH
jgi:hypothetical protein